MRVFLLVLIIAWLLGVCAGVGPLPWWSVLLVSGGVGLVAHVAGQSRPVSTAAGCLVFIAYLSVPLVTLASPCSIPVPAVATIAEQMGGTTRSQRYLAVTPDDCRAVITIAPLPRLQPGDVIELTGASPEPVTKLVSEYPEYAEYLRQQGVSATWYFPDVTLRTSNRSVTQRMHARATANIKQLFPEPTAGLAAAMLLNETTGLSDEFTTIFRATGLSHIIAISGSNVSLLTGMVLLVLLMLPLSPRVRTTLLIGGLWLYIGFIGAPVSAARAALFWTMALIAFRLHRLVSLPTVFFLTAAAMITFDPYLVRDVGFQLSMAAVGGIFVVTFLRPRVRAGSVPGLTGVRNALLVTLGATAATAPISAYHFGTFAPIGLVANLLVVPLMSLFLIVGIAALLLSLLFPLGGAIVASGAHVLVRLTIWIADRLAVVPGGYLENMNTPWWVLVVYYGVAAGVAHWWLKRQGRHWREVWQ